MHVTMEMSAWLERFWKNIIPQETGHTYSPNMINQTEFFIGPNKQFRAHGFYLKIWKGRFSNPAKFQGTMKTWEPDYVHKLRHSFNILIFFVVVEKKKKKKSSLKYYYWD